MRSEGPTFDRPGSNTATHCANLPRKLPSQAGTVRCSVAATNVVGGLLQNARQEVPLAGPGVSQDMRQQLAGVCLSEAMLRLILPSSCPLHPPERGAQTGPWRGFLKVPAQSFGSMHKFCWSRHQRQSLSLLVCCLLVRATRKLQFSFSSLPQHMHAPVSSFHSGPVPSSPVTCMHLQEMSWGFLR